MINLLNTAPLDVFEHMAIDELLATGAALATGRQLAGPLLRFFNWTQGAAATFGYAQFKGH